MLESPVYRPHDEAPARATFHSMDRVAGRPGILRRSFEYVSRGDFVPGRVLLTEATKPGRSPLVLLTHGIGESTDALSRFETDLARQGFAVAMIDLPLHGRRWSPKLSDRLYRGVRELTLGGSLDPDTRALVEEFARQSTSDLIRGLDALSALPEIDANRLALVGFGLGAVVSAYAVAHDERPSACALARGIGRFSDRDLDPASRIVARTASRGCPLLVIDSPNDSDFPEGGTRAFFDAVPEPKDWAEIREDPAETTQISPEAAQQISGFLAKHLAP